MSTDRTPAVWMVTGASSGLGRAIAQAALDAGDSVVATARKAGGLDDLVERYPDRVAAVELDVTDTARVPGAVAAATEAFGRVDVLVNSAGRALIGAAEETTDEELRDLMDVHFFGPAALSRAVLPGMRARGSGAIVQISSMGGRLSFAAVSAYSATKFALEGYSEALAAEVAPFGIRVLVVEPGAFRTGLHGAAMRITTPIAAYDAVVGPIRAMQAGFDGTQPGDPAKAAAAIRAALDADEPPLRLPLGNDAADAVAESLDRLRAEFLAWEPVARSTDLDPA
ncbi:SDR family NAD(P)-dependent oxidoreductase [Jiangella aurantiaca]|uniref:SDR family NAD(P)-dependent oxidoreductase n=1 Tax=Jiangella aurantiaca TaxID=2530373 RepID=A0A4R5A2S6_9ACTN|nr:oxidoreductase [Jiangella aurantiaca]TDD63792.1 SDR family NAD(P)-dependent oxidoreductase [Jiangella aurantiaca]